MGNNCNRSFGELDGRRYVLHEDHEFKLIIYQIELLRIINLLESVNSNCIANKLKRIIFLRDKKEGTYTEYNRALPKGDISRYILSPKQNIEIQTTQDLIDSMAKTYYKKIK